MESSFGVGKDVVIDFIDVNVPGGGFFAMSLGKSRRSPPAEKIGPAKKDACVLH